MVEKHQENRDFQTALLHRNIWEGSIGNDLEKGKHLKKNNHVIHLDL